MRYGLRDTVTATLHFPRSLAIFGFKNIAVFVQYGEQSGRRTKRGLAWNLESTLTDARVTAKGPRRLCTFWRLAENRSRLGRLGEAEAELKAEERKLEAEVLLVNRYQLAFLKGDAAQMERFASAAMGKPGTEDPLLAAQADTQAWYGKMKNARELTRRAMDSAEHNDATESAASYQAASALREVEIGNREQAREEAHAALKLAPSRDGRAMAVLALARAGDAAAAEKLADELDKEFPLDTLVQRYWLPTIRAAVAIEGRDSNRGC